MSGVSYWLRAFTGLYQSARGNVPAPYIAERIKPLVVREARLFALVYIVLTGLVIAGRWEPLLYWFLPMLLAQPFWRGWLLAEHTGCTNDDDIYANTRTTYTNPLLRFLLWQMPYHVAHHAYPGVPFFALKRADVLISGRSKAQSPGYLTFHRQWISRIRGVA
jgi:fatty acid desaturase